MNNDPRLYLIKHGEIALKGLNRNLFEKRLKQNIKTKLRGYQTTILSQKGRFFLEVEASCPTQVIESVLATTFGLTGFARCLRTEKSEEAIRRGARLLMKEEPFSRGEGSYKADSRRADKSFMLTSYQLDCLLAEEVHALHPNLRVDVKTPDMTIYCEIRDAAYLYTSPKAGLGGLPVGTAGKGMLLLSGGIDSPVAGYMMAQRGLRMECVYFHAYPYTSDEALEKVKTLASLIAPYLQGTRLHVVPFTDAQLHINANAAANETTLMFRAAMMEVTNMLADRHEGLCLVTGEALSQVASQTVEGLDFSNSFSDRVVLRPLVGLDKAQIITLARQIDTYETSILPYEDCCTIFSPKHPLTRPNKKAVSDHYRSLEMGALLEDAVQKTVHFDFTALGLAVD